MEIQTDIPIPTATVSANSIGIAATLKRLSVGDSFFVPNKSASMRSRIASSASRLRISITQRATEENGTPGLRVWRKA